MKSILLGLLITALIFTCQGATWSGAVKTDTGSWYLSRESGNLSFSMDQSVDGQISPVYFRNRSLTPYHSLYKDLSVNDVQVKERTAALEGSIRSEESLELFSHINNSIDAIIYKPSGSDLYSIEFFEKWPVTLKDRKSLDYSGAGINARDFVGNNRDFAGANFLYNPELSMERDFDTRLDRLNASIFATDESIHSAEIMATKSMNYSLSSHSTGIANLKYKQLDADGALINENDERYVGEFDIARKLHIGSRFDTTKDYDHWLPCCTEGFSDMNPMDKKAYKSAKGIFDCTCFVPQTKAQFQR